MKAFSPVRSVRKTGLSEHNLGISRSKTPVDDPMSLLYNMNDCYSKLKELVPSIPQNKKVSKMEILQHVIDYILDLQIALDSHPSIVSLHHQRPGQNPSSRTPLTTLNTDISILSLQVSASPAPRLAADPDRGFRAALALWPARLAVTAPAVRSLSRREAAPGRATGEAQQEPGQSAPASLGVLGHLALTQLLFSRRRPSSPQSSCQTTAKHFVAKSNGECSAPFS
ncbi:hypothetical protein IHE44_0009690 [Lamprotornis superbus]|uniref:BHLH domain-containing protein n=3 Tax=Passeriformes TaxID=9126 RepID=A0A835P3J6_9PASS|nr:hypothetical protein IHE44_0009690 [Lamprotornis superbus]